MRAEAAARSAGAGADALRKRLHRLQSLEARARAVLLPAAPAGLPGATEAVSKSGPAAAGEPWRLGGGGAVPHMRTGGDGDDVELAESAGAEAGAAEPAVRMALASILTPAGGSGGGSPGRSGTPPQVTLHLVYLCYFWRVQHPVGHADGHAGNPVPAMVKRV